MLTTLNTIRLFGIPIHKVCMQEAVCEVMRWVQERNLNCRYVVTPNVDHTVMYQENAQLRAAYEQASLILADGAPVIWASRILGRALPERVTGADLVPSLFAAATLDQPLRVYLLGAGPGVALRAQKNIERRWPNVKVVGTYSPPMGFEKNDAENNAIIRRVNETQPDILLLGLGAPKQELWIYKHASELQTSAALCVGAAIDFLAGEKSRAPQLLQRAGLEWLHRLATEPKRLFRRYARDAWIFPQLMWREWRGTA